MQINPPVLIDAALIQRVWANCLARDLRYSKSTVRARAMKEIKRMLKNRKEVTS